MRIPVDDYVNVVNLFNIGRGNNVRRVPYSINFSAIKQNYFIGVLRGQINVMRDKHHGEILHGIQLLQQG